MSESKCFNLNRWQIYGTKALRLLCFSHDSLAVVHMHNLIVKKKDFVVVNRTD